MALPKRRDQQLQWKGDFDEQREVGVEKKKGRKIELICFTVISPLHQTVYLEEVNFAE